MNRRQMLRSLAGACSALALNSPPSLSAAASPSRTRLGIVTYCLSLRQKALAQGGAGKSLADPLTFLEECRALGAGGIQTDLGIRDETYAAQLRRRAEALDMHVEGAIQLPYLEADLPRFEQQVETAARAGATLARATLMPGRRYEQFTSLKDYQAAVARGLKALQLAEPLLARRRFRLALENHKDQRVAERLELLKRLSSEYVGACVDVGNDLALLADPIEVVRAYAPWAFTAHLKDQAVQEYEEGFLLADAALGEGLLDLPAMLEVLRQAKPGLRFNLEVITRDPLNVPVLTDNYWATLADVPASDLARALRLVKAKSSRQPLACVSKLAPAQQVEAETGNILRSLAYARERLGL
jgi:sugar phosphate isomerase/epimerase